MNRRGVGIIGFGRTGRGMLDFLLNREKPRPILLFTDLPVSEGGGFEEYKNRGVEFVSGEEGFARLFTMETVVLSPGVDGSRKRFRDLRNGNVDVVSELEYAFRFNRGTLVGVTGTNGKSTTVSLIHHLLLRAGKTAHLAGNIGTPFISLVDRIEDEDVVVLEISSFQLEEIRTFCPHVGVLLNLTPDHLDRYPGMAEYAAAKMNLFLNQTPHDFQVMNQDDGLVREVHGNAGLGRTVWFSRSGTPADGVYADGGQIVLNCVPGGDRVPLDTFPLPGPHNLENYMAAAAVVRLLGVPGHLIAEGVADFQGLAHRMENVGIIDGVRFINDSKATNVDAAEKAIQSLDGEAVLILGGKDKGGEFSRLEALIRRHVRRVLLVGQASDTIRNQLSGISEKLEEVADLQEAVDRGFALLRGGGQVLLAPGCASFDMFRSFEHRGDVFRAAVSSLAHRLDRQGRN